MRLTEKENETLPIDVGNFDSDNNFNLSSYNKLEIVIFPVMFFFLFADCITDLIIVCDDLLRYCPHCWRVQRHGRLLRAEKQVS